MVNFGLTEPAIVAEKVFDSYSTGTKRLVVEKDWAEAASAEASSSSLLVKAIVLWMIRCYIVKEFNEGEILQDMRWWRRGLSDW